MPVERAAMYAVGVKAGVEAMGAVATTGGSINASGDAKRWLASSVR